MHGRSTAAAAAAVHFAEESITKYRHHAPLSSALPSQHQDEAASAASDEGSSPSCRRSPSSSSSGSDNELSASPLISCSIASDLTGPGKNMGGAQTSSTVRRARLGLVPGLVSPAENELSASRKAGVRVLNLPPQRAVSSTSSERRRPPSPSPPAAAKAPAPSWLESQRCWSQKSLIRRASEQ